MSYRIPAFLCALIFLPLSSQSIKPINPKIAYEVGWWVYQDNLKITNVSVVKDSKGHGPSWLHNKADILITIDGTIEGKSGWAPAIESLHVSQSKTAGQAEARIVITPVVELKSQRSYTGGAIPFKIVKRLSIPAMDWGPNKYIIQIGEITNTLVFQNSK